MEVTIKMSFSELNDPRNFKKFLFQFGNKLRLITGIVCSLILICYYIFLYTERDDEFFWLMNMIGILMIVFGAYVMIFFAQFQMMLTRRLYRKMKMSGEIEIKFKGQFVYLTGDRFSIRLTIGLLKFKKEMGIKDKKIYLVVESLDRFYFIHANAFFIFVDKNKLQEDELEYVRGKLKEAYDMRYHVVSR